MHTKCTLRHRTNDGTVGSIDSVELDGAFAQTFQVRPVDRENPAFINDERNANARRLVACWNACEGLTTENLESVLTVGDTLASRFKARDDIESDLTKQRDELLVALKDARELVDDWGAYASNYMQEKHDLAGDIERLDSAIAKVEG